MDLSNLSGAAAAGGAGKAPRASQEPASKQLVHCVESCAILAMRMISTVAISTAALEELRPQLQNRKLQYIPSQGGPIMMVLDTISEQLCMRQLVAVATDAHVTKVLCGLLPLPQQDPFTTACTAVQQLSSTSGLTPQHMLSVYLPMAAVPITWGAMCCNPQCLQLPMPGDATKKRQVRGSWVDRARKGITKTIRGPIYGTCPSAQANLNIISLYCECLWGGPHPVLFVALRNTAHMCQHN